MKHSVLMVYDKFPPFNVSGTARAFHFVKNLPSLGWTPIVLTGQPGPGDAQDPAPLDLLPPEVRVLRALPWLTPQKDRLAHWFNRKRAPRSAGGPSASPRTNSRRVFTPGSLTWRMTGLPMWVLEWHFDWAPAALLRALGDGDARRADLVWVSAPHVRNLFVGEALSRLLNKPLVVDLRDPWTYGSLWLPRGDWVARVERARASQILSRAARVVVTSPLTQAQMERRFPRARFVTITNGFTRDESIQPLREIAPGKCLFRYIGVLNERRKPDSLLEGLAIACKAPGLRDKVHLEFVGGMAGHERSIARLGLDDVVSARGPVSFKDSLRLMRGSDVNVVLQTISEGQDVIAGKTFEYLAAGKPVLGVVSEQGGDAWLLQRVGGAHLARYDDSERIAAAIQACVRDFEAGAPGPERERLAAFDREQLSTALARLFDEVCRTEG